MTGFSFSEYWWNFPESIVNRESLSEASFPPHACGEGEGRDGDKVGISPVAMVYSVSLIIRAEVLKLIPGSTGQFDQPLPIGVADLFAVGGMD